MRILLLIIGIIIGLLVFRYTNSHIFVDWSGIAGCTAYALLPFIDRKRVRVRWATFTILFNGLLGTAILAFYLALNKGWLVASGHQKHVIHKSLLFAGIIFLGVTLILILSGQFFGSKREGKDI